MTYSSCYPKEERKEGRGRGGEKRKITKELWERWREKET